MSLTTAKKHLQGKAKRALVMGKFKKGKLKSSSGETVTNPKQAVAIAYSEAGEKKDGKQ